MPSVVSSKDRSETEEPNRYYMWCLHRVPYAPGQEVGGLSLTSCAYLHSNSKATRVHGLGFFLSSRPFDLVLDLSRSKQAKQSKKSTRPRRYCFPRPSLFLPPYNPPLARCSRARFELERPLATTISAEFWANLPWATPSLWHHLPPDSVHRYSNR